MKPARFRFPSAVHLFLIREERILLLRRFNTGYEDGNYSVVAGHLNGGEEVRAAAVREAREEVGITIAPEDIQVVGVMHRNSEDERIDWFVTATRWTGEIVNAEPDKCDELLWSAPDCLPRNMVPYVRRAIENYARGIWFGSFGWGLPEARSRRARNAKPFGLG
jgi:ADP-ribose pyrophosphatase YjhB (NUDIX family)